MIQDALFRPRRFITIPALSIKIVKPRESGFLYPAYIRGRARARIKRAAELSALFHSAAVQANTHPGARRHYRQLLPGISTASWARETSQARRPCFLSLPRALQRMAHRFDASLINLVMKLAACCCAVAGALCAARACFMYELCAPRISGGAPLRFLCRRGEMFMLRGRWVVRRRRTDRGCSFYLFGLSSGLK